MAVFCTICSRTSRQCRKGIRVSCAVCSSTSIDGVRQKWQSSVLSVFQQRQHGRNTAILCTLCSSTSMNSVGEKRYFYVLAKTVMERNDSPLCCLFYFQYKNGQHWSEMAVFCTVCSSTTIDSIGETALFYHRQCRRLPAYLISVCGLVQTRWARAEVAQNPVHVLVCSSKCKKA